MGDRSGALLPVLLARRCTVAVRLLRTAFAVVSPARIAALAAIIVTYGWDRPGALIAKTLFGYGIVPAHAARIATKDPPDREDHSHKKPTFFKRLDGVGRAARYKPTAGPALVWGNVFFVKAHQRNAKLLHLTLSRSPKRSNARTSSRSTSCAFLPRISSLATSTTR